MKASLFDIQINGFAGVDFQQPNLSLADVRQAVDGLARHETLRFFLTLLTDGMDALCGKLENLERIRGSDAGVGEAVCGYHLEGPWLSPEPGYCGAHDASHMRLPDLADFDRLQAAAGGNLRLVTLAPELPGSSELIHHAVASGVQVSLGHTNASDPDIAAAIAAGARFCTHLGNGVPAQMHRHDNVIQHLLARDELAAFFIPDGIHLPPNVLRNFYRAKPPGKRYFTTDCMAAAGAGPGRYSLAHHDLEVGGDRIVRSPGATNFAGSALAPDEGLENIRRWLHLDDAAVRAAFSTGIAAEFGISLPMLPAIQCA